jgi:hypothetical protein
MSIGTLPNYIIIVIIIHIIIIAQGRSKNFVPLLPRLKIFQISCPARVLACPMSMDVTSKIMP